MHSYSIAINNTQLTLILIAKIDRATHGEWGYKFGLAIPTIQPCNYMHNNACMTAMLKELARVDKVCKLNNASAPTTGIANAVSDKVSYLSKLLQHQTIKFNAKTNHYASAIQTNKNASTDIPLTATGSKDNQMYQ